MAADDCRILGMRAHLLLGSWPVVLASVTLTSALRGQTAWSEPPAIIAAPVSVTETLGGAASFLVRAGGSAPLSYQWRHDGVPLSGETRAALTRAPIAASDGGSYSVTITNPAGSVTSDPVMLSLLPAPASIVDLTFRADSSLNATPTALLPLPDGSVLVANGKTNQLLKLRVDGSLDPSWVVSTFVSGTMYGVSMRTLALQADGRVLVGGDFGSFNGQSRQNLLRLNRDGALDTTFVPATAATAQPVLSIALAGDGRILIANNQTTPICLLADGQTDPSFQPQPLTPAVTLYGQKRDWYIVAVDAAVGGKVVVGALTDIRFTNVLPMPVAQVVRLEPDGTIDPTFAPLRWNGGFEDLRVLDDGGVLAINDGARGTATPGSATPQVCRVQSDGTPFPNYLNPTIEAPITTSIYRTGEVVYVGIGAPGPIRLTALGAVDMNFTGGIGAPTPSVIAAAANGQVWVAGAFVLYNGQPSQHVARLNAIPNPTPNAPRILSLDADKTTVSYGEPITVRAAVVGSAELTYEWTGAVGVAPNDILWTNSPTLTFTFSSQNQATILHLTVRNPRGDATGAPIDFTVLPDAPVITQQPTRISAQSGRDLTIHVERNPTAGNSLAAEWRHNGQLLPQSGGPSPVGETLSLPSVTAAEAGTYTLTLRNVFGATVTSAPIVVTVDDSSRFCNLSTRAFVGPGEQTLIAGFAIPGYDVRKILIRAVGPTLARFGVPGLIPDPQIKLTEVGNQLDYSMVFSTDGWDANSTDGNASARAEFTKVGAFPLDAGSKDNAGWDTLAADNYTVQITSKSGQTGTALVEIYEDDNDAARIRNLSTRAMIPPATPAISGFVIQGPTAMRVLLRAVGPGLKAFGVSKVLTNPRLILKNADGATIAANDDWESGGNAGELSVTTTAVGGFPLASGSQDAALLATLAPGSYTLITDGGTSEPGVALIEIYDAQ